MKLTAKITSKVPARISAWAMVTALLIGLQACGAGGVAALFISTDDERNLGDSFHAMVRRGDPDILQAGEALWTPRNAADSAFKRYFDSMANKIVNEIPDDDMEDLYPEGISARNRFFSFHIIKSSQENAFAVPGGYVYFYTTILKNFKSEAELAGVFAHEVGHVVLHHSREAMLKSAAAGAVVDALLGDENLSSTIADLGVGFWMNENSQSNESESDSIGVTYTGAAGFKPNGVQTYFSQNLEIDASGNCTETTVDDVMEVFSTHPSNCERVTHVKALIAALPASQQSQPDNAALYRSILTGVSF